MAKYKCIRIELYKRDITVFIGSHEEFKEWIKTNDCTETWRDIINQILVATSRQDPHPKSA